MAYRARNIMIAVALAAVAALLTSFYVTSYKRHVQRGEDHVTVLVAKKDIPEGTSGADASHMLSPLEVPRRSVVPGAISSADQISSLVATKPTLEGEQVTMRRFSPVAERGIRADLKGNLRAFQVSGDVNQTLAGTLHDGDRVDMVATFKYKKAGGSSGDTFFASRVRPPRPEGTEGAERPACWHQADERAAGQLRGHARRHRPAGPEAPVRDDPDWWPRRR